MQTAFEERNVKRWKFIRISKTSFEVSVYKRQIFGSSYWLQLHHCAEARQSLTWHATKSSHHYWTLVYWQFSASFYLILALFLFGCWRTWPKIGRFFPISHCIPRHPLTDAENLQRHLTTSLSKLFMDLMVHVFVSFFIESEIFDVLLSTIEFIKSWFEKHH